jgi:hypothetical protein
MALKSMSIEKLVALKGQVEAALSSKVLEQRRALESHLSKLGRFQFGKSTSKAARGSREPPIAREHGVEGRERP